MKIESKKSAVTITIVLDESEAIMLAQLANQVAGGSPRAQFYGSFGLEIAEALRKHNVEVPPAAQDFKVYKGKFFALPLPNGIVDAADEAPEPKMGVTPKFV